MRKEIHVAFALDVAYLKQAAIAIASIIANASTPEDLRFYIVHAEDEDRIAELTADWRVPHLTTVRAGNPFAEVGDHTHVSNAALIRTLLPDLLHHLDRLIYLDVDLVVTGDIRDLWDSDLHGNAIGGVLDIGVHVHAAREKVYGGSKRRNGLALLGLDPDRPEYINSGVLLMDLDKLRDIGFGALAQDMDRQFRGRLLYVDQDIVNCLVAGRVQLLDPRWNVSAKLWSGKDRRRHHYVAEHLSDQLALQKREQWLVHWVGRHKPWNNGSVWRAEEWWRYAGLSGLEWERPEPRRRSFGSLLRDVWLDARSMLSALRYRLHRLANPPQPADERTAD